MGLHTVCRARPQMATGRELLPLVAWWCTHMARCPEPYHRVFLEEALLSML